MSSLWTPGGERPVGPPPAAGGGPPPGPGAVAPDRQGGEPDEAVLAAQLETMRAELAATPVEVVVANHCYGLFELAAVYLSQQPPLLEQARLAIDALGTLVGGLEGRLGEAEVQLKDGLSQLRLAFVQIDGALRAGAEAASTLGANGGAAPTPDEPAAQPGPNAEA